MNAEAEAHEARALQLQRQAERLFAQAREHKRAANRHRRRTREIHGQLDELIQACAARGIHIRINTQPEGGPSVKQETAA